MRLEISKWNPFRFMRRARGDGGENRGNSALLMPESMGLAQDPLGDPFDVDRWFGDYSPARFQPRIDVVDEGDALRISADLPGMDRKDVEVLIEDGFLVLRGEKKVESTKEEEGCYRVERAFGSFQRVIPLPQDVDAARAEARFDKGVLALRLPKLPGESSEVRRIEVK